MQRKHMVWSIAISGIILGHVLGGRVEAGERRYYLTKGTVVGNAALAACHEGDPHGVVVGDLQYEHTRIRWQARGSLWRIVVAPSNGSVWMDSNREC